MVADVLVCEGFPDVVQGRVSVLFVVIEELLQGWAEVGGVGPVAGVARLGFEATGEDLLLEAVEAGRDTLEVEGLGEGGGDGGLAGGEAC